MKYKAAVLLEIEADFPEDLEANIGFVSSEPGVVSTRFYLHPHNPNGVRMKDSKDYAGRKTEQVYFRSLLAEGLFE